MSRLHLLRVFCAADGSGGNPLGVFLDGAEVPPERRQAVAADLALSETVFVDDAGDAARSASSRRPRSWTSRATRASGPRRCSRAPIRSGRPRGRFRVRRDGDDVYVTARPEWGPAFELVELGSPDEVDALDGPPGGPRAGGRLVVDRRATRARSARACSPWRIGIAEDEATGSAATKLCAHAGRPVEIRQGRGSRIRARPAAGGFVEIGGRSVVDDVRDYRLP